MSASIALGPPRPLLARFERALLGAKLTLAMFASGLLVLAVLWQTVFPDGRILSDLVAGVAALLVAVPVLAAVWDSLLHPSLHGVTDRLIAVALVAAWASGDLMTAAVLPIIMILGHVLEERSLLGSREAIQALTRLAETSVRRFEPGGGVETVPSAALRRGDRIELLPGSRVPADGVVRAGEAGLDMASLTGESVPVDVGPGDVALAGSINTNGRLELEVTGLGAETTLGKIIALMRTAERAKPPVARLLERYAGHQLALVLMIAAGTWLASGDTAATLAVHRDLRRRRQADRGPVAEHDRAGGRQVPFSSGMAKPNFGVVGGPYNVTVTLASGQSASVSLAGGDDNSGTTVSQFFGFYGGGVSALTISTSDPMGLGFGISSTCRNRRRCWCCWLASPGWRGRGGMCGRPEARLSWRLVSAMLGLAGGAVAAEPPRLMGILISGQDRVALFATTPTLWAREGDLVGDERVTAIEAAAVHLDGPAGPRLVEPGEDRSTRTALGNTAPPTPLIDPYRRERETENDQ